MSAREAGGAPAPHGDGAGNGNGVNGNSVNGNSVNGNGRAPQMLDEHGNLVELPAEGVRFVPFGGGPAVHVAPPEAPPEGKVRAPRMLDEDGNVIDVPAEGVRFVPFAPPAPSPSTSASTPTPTSAPAPISTPASTSASAEPAPVLAAAPPELRSDELQEVVGFVPHWLVRWGITLVFATVAVMLAITWVVRYPEVMRGKATLTTPEPPVRVVARTAGELQRVFVADGQRVERGAPLAVVRGPADWRAVLALAERLEGFDPAAPGASAAAFGPEEALGDVQGPYTQFRQALADLRAFEAAPFDAAKEASLRRQMDDQRRLRATLAEQQVILEEKLAIAERERTRARELAARGLLSAQEQERAESEYLERRLAVANGRNAITGADIQLSGYESSGLDLRQRHEEQRRQYALALRAAFDALNAAVRRWQQEHLLRAPISGRVSFFRELAENQYVGAAEPLIAVVPSEGAPRARVRLPHAAAGRVRPGQKVILRFDSYPPSEFGTVRGRVERVSLVPDPGEEDEPEYLLDVSLPDGLVTSYRRRLPFQQEMRGTADVVTDDLRLFERIFNQLRYVAATARS